MNKLIKRQLAAFQACQRRSARYHVSQSTPHERAMREHILRGFESGLTRVAGLLNQENKI